MRNWKNYFTTVNFIVIVILINIALSFYSFLKIDFTKDKIHSISAESKNIIKNLKDNVGIKVLMSEELPTEAKVATQKLKAILQEINTINRDKLIVTYVDPGKNEEANQLAMGLGIKPIQFSTIKRDKFEMQNAYLAIVLTYGQKQEVLNLDLENMEYLIVSGIKRITSDKQKIILISEELLNDKTQYQIVRKYLAKDYAIENIDLNSKQELNVNADELVILDNNEKLEKSAIEKLNKWIDLNKSIIIFADRVAVDNDLKVSVKNNLELIAWLKEKGIEIEEKLVVDNESGLATVSDEGGQYMVPYSFWPKINQENINRSLPVMSGIDTLTLAWVNPIRLDKGAISLFTSSKQSSVNDDLVDLSPNVTPNNTGGKLVLGAYLPDQKIAVVSDSDFIKDQFIINNDRNLYLVLNMVDYFAQENDLMAIRSKVLRIAPLKDLSDSNKLLIKIISTISPVLVLLLTGFIYNKIRRKNNCGL